MKTVAVFTEPWEAHLFRLLLEAEGLFAVVASDQHAWVNYSFAWAIGGVRVQVVEAELQQARAIEQRCRAGEFQAALDAEVGPPEMCVCPRCGSQDYQRRRSSSYFLSLMATLTFAIAVPIRAYIDRCSRCGKSWVE